MESVIIIGAGISGLSCANQLLDYNLHSVLIDASRVGTLKMCGEFIAPSAIQYLKHWDVNELEEIHTIRFHSGNNTFSSPLSFSGGAKARHEVEILLARRLISHGIIIKENTFLQEVIDRHSYKEIYLSNGETLKTKKIVYATGKFGQKRQVKILPYTGFKLKLNKILENNTLQMYSFENSYLGLVPISSAESNCACLIKNNSLKSVDEVEHFIYRLLAKNPDLKQFFKNIDIQTAFQLLGAAPHFQIKQKKIYSGDFFIGDALAVFPPAIGYGFAHAVLSGVDAAEMIANQLTKKIVVKSRGRSIARKMFIGKIINKILLKEKLTTLLIKYLPAKSILAKFILKKLEYLS